MKKKLTTFSLVLLLTCFIGITSWCQVPGAINEDYYTYAGFDNIVYCAQVDEAGNKILGGLFTNYNNNVAYRNCRLNSSNELDTLAFDKFNSATSTSVYSIAKSLDGGYLIGGVFTQYDGKDVGGLVKVDADGVIDTMFNYLGSGLYYATNYFPLKIEQMPDGKIYMAGNFFKYNDELVPDIIRLNPDGTRDITFNLSLTTISTIEEFEIMPDGNLLIGGLFSNVYGGVTKNGIAKIHPDGSFDTTFHLNGTGTSSASIYKVNDIVRLGDGTILAGGNFTTINGIVRNGLVKLNADGIVDVTFNAAFLIGTEVKTIYLEPDKILLCGYNIKSGANILTFMALNYDGTVHLTFPKYFSDGSVFEITKLPDGGYFLNGSFTNFNNRLDRCIVQLNEDGSFNNSVDFTNGLYNNVMDFVLDEADTVYAVGDFVVTDRFYTPGISKILPEGGFDSTFNIGTGFNATTRFI